LVHRVSTSCDRTSSIATATASSKPTRSTGTRSRIRSSSQTVSDFSPSMIGNAIDAGTGVTRFAQ
jgi:hypothetical protein